MRAFGAPRARRRPLSKGCVFAANGRRFRFPAAPTGAEGHITKLGDCMNVSKLAPVALAIAGACAVGIARAENIATTDGNFTVIESVAPLGTALHYVSGGNGLIGTT